MKSENIKASSTHFDKKRDILHHNNIGEIQFSIAKNELIKNIVGEIVFADEPSKAIKKWRKIFKINQKQLASKLGISGSVISDYESGRRKSPGVNVIKKYINALLHIDLERGGPVIKSFMKDSNTTNFSSAIMDMNEFSTGIKIEDFCKNLNADILTKSGAEKEIYGYTIIDSIKAITELSFNDLVKLYGVTTQRALIFTKVSTGRSPMVAIKVTNLYPGLVVLHGLNEVDELAKRIAELEKIPLAICRLENPDKIVEKLRKKYGK